MKHTVYLILFRGVGGKTQLPVAALREKLTKAGFENVATLHQQRQRYRPQPDEPEAGRCTIAELCRKHFDFNKAIFAPTLAEWDDVIARNRFSKAALDAPTTVHAVLLANTPKAQDIECIRARAVKGEAIEVIGGVAYLHTPHGFGRAR